MADPATNLNSADGQIMEDDQVFYNVLPPEKADSPLTKSGEISAMPTSATERPSLSSTTQTAPTGLQSLLAKLPKPKVLLMIGGGVIVLGAITILGYMLLNRTEEPVPIQNQEPTGQEPETPQQLEGVTTTLEWQKRYFGTEVCSLITVCGDEADPDRDGLNNLDEFDKKTDPNNPDSNGGGLSDGDKVHIFNLDPLKTKTKDGEYSDADYVKYGYDITTDQPYTPERLEEIKAKIKQLGLHQPTIDTIGEEGWTLYDFVNPEGPKTPAFDPSTIDQSSNAKLDRDTQRSNTIKKIGIGLTKYFEQNKVYPSTTEFSDVVVSVKPFITVATNFVDPINQDKYVYGYVPGDKNKDFTLTYFSETQNLLIKYRAADAQTDAAKENSGIYDDQRIRDLDNLRTALLLYSSRNLDTNGTQEYVFPASDKYKSELLNNGYISQIPKDPKTDKDYEYKVGEQFDTFTLKTILDNAPEGTTGYLCNQEECRNY
jgi:hypothetical protein